MWLGVVGVALTCLGVFCPLMSLPLVGSMNYFLNGRGDGVLLFIGAVVCSFLLALRIYWPMWVAAFINAGLLSQLAFRMQKLATEPPETNNAMANAMAKAMINAFQIQWGWFVLVLGAIAMSASASLNRSRGLSSDRAQAVLTAMLVVVAGAVAGFLLQSQPTLRQAIRL